MNGHKAVDLILQIVCAFLTRSNAGDGVAIVVVVALVVNMALVVYIISAISTAVFSSTAPTGGFTF